MKTDVLVDVLVDVDVETLHGEIVKCASGMF